MALKDWVVDYAYRVKGGLILQPKTTRALSCVYTDRQIARHPVVWTVFEMAFFKTYRQQDI